MEEIIASIYNGNRKQALSQLSDSKYNLSDLAERLIQEGSHREVVVILEVAFNLGYMVENKNLPDSKFY